MHDFNEDLKRSHQKRDASFWEAFYRHRYPTLVKIEDCSQDMSCQRLGIDVKLHLASGQKIKVDEKDRDKDYGDIVLEYEHRGATVWPGWIEKDLGIDYIAYAVYKQFGSRVHFIDWHSLRLAWRRYGKAWIEYGHSRQNGFSIAKSPNRDYDTYSVCVPPRHLFAALRDTFTDYEGQDFCKSPASSEEVHWDNVLDKEGESE